MIAFRLFGPLVATLLFGLTASGADRPQIGVWMSPGGPHGIWEKSYGDPFPVRLIVADLAKLGVTDIFFFEQAGRGGPFLHPTKVQYAQTEKRMKDRDWLGELLEAAAAPGIRVWLAWTPPGDKYPGTEFRGLNHPAIQKIYLDEIEELAARYGRSRSLAGIMWHEVDCSEHPDMHEDDRAEFSAYCQATFGQPYTGAAMPPAVNPQDPAWRRFALYKIHVVNRLVARTAEAARRHGLGMHFCSYAPESSRGESWRWGYDIVALERLCDQQWFSAYSVESGKAFQHIRGAWLDFGPSYEGQILPRNYAYMFHGARPSYFEYRTPVYLDAMRRHYSTIKSFAAKYPDVYTDFFGHSQEELALFFGRENLGAWLRAATAWQGGRSTAGVAVAVHPTPFVLAHPASPGGEYEKKVRGLMLALSRTTDVDALTLESRYALDAGNLSAYRLIVIPEDMGRLLSAEMAETLRQYVARGGKLLVIATGVSRGRADLAGEVDLTGRLCGVEIVGPGLPGYVEPETTAIGGRPGRFWGGQRVPLRLVGAKILVRNQASGEALLVQKGGVSFSALGFSPEAAGYFQAVVRNLAPMPVALESQGDLRILEGVAKDERVCLALWGPGHGKLSVDLSALAPYRSRLPGGIGATSPARQAEPTAVTDIVTGAELGQPTAAQLWAGIPIEIKYPNQPLILAIGPADKAQPAKGIYASAEVFRNLPAKQSVDNPEVPHELLGAAAATATAGGAGRPSRVRDKELGVLDYFARYETKMSKRDLDRSGKDCVAALEEAGLKPEWVDVDLFLPAGRAERNRYKRIFIPGTTGYLSQAMLEGMADYVRSGGLLVSGASLILLDSNANYRVDPGEGVTHFASNGFLGVFGHAGCTMDRLMVTRSSPLTAGLPEGWLPLQPPTGGRRTTIQSAETLIVAAGTHGDAKIERQPFLTFKHTGRGAAIYLVGQVGAKSDPRLKQILKNALSPETLRWLCWQP